MNNFIFPVSSNNSYIPDNFKCWSLDLSLPEFTELAFSGCSCIILVECPAGWNISRRGDWEERHLDFYFIESGSFTLRTKDKVIHAKAGEILQITSWDDRYLEQTASGRHVYVRFNNPENYPAVSASRCHECNAIEDLNFYTTKLLHPNVNLPNEKLYRQFLAQLIHILLQRELHWLSDSESEEIQKLQQILNDSQRRNFEVLPIAKQMGMSFSKFRNFCLKNFGKSPRKVVEDILMTRARGMLNYSPLTIDDIAEQLGFSDRFAFSKAFARHNNTSPVAYRKYFNK
ncbi:MAG: helix-turn-helix transcriptional regulator [Lentisphaeria bacterium]|nr:helix-turn-helix transcriptional regulator [Lentisphaeria bacterium]